MPDSDPEVRLPYPKTEIPKWCRMPLEGHACAGGCWGISMNDPPLEGRGEDYCKECEFYEVRDLQLPVRHS